MLLVLDWFLLARSAMRDTGNESRGWAADMANGCAEAGADLVLVGRDEQNLRQAAAELSAPERSVVVLAADLSSPEEAERLCDRALTEAGPIDILINNVGGRRENIPTVDAASDLACLDLVSSSFRVQAFGAAMLPRKWGRIINVASISGQVAVRGIAGRHYETAKAALVGFTKAVAADWAAQGITVNAIAPGGFMTDANRRWFRERPEFIKEFETQIPLGRLGEPEEIGPLAVYLASEASRYMTGGTCWCRWKTATLWCRPYAERRSEQASTGWRATPRSATTTATHPAHEAVTARLLKLVKFCVFVDEHFFCPAVRTKRLVRQQRTALAMGILDFLALRQQLFL